MGGADNQNSTAILQNILTEVKELKKTVYILQNTLITNSKAKAILSFAETAAVLNISTTTLHKQINDKQILPLPRTKKGSKIYFSTKEILNYKKARYTPNRAELSINNGTGVATNTL